MMPNALKLNKQVFIHSGPRARERSKSLEWTTLGPGTSSWRTPKRKQPRKARKEKGGHPNQALRARRVKLQGSKDKNQQGTKGVQNKGKQGKHLHFSSSSILTLGPSVSSHAEIRRHQQFCGLSTSSGFPGTPSQSSSSRTEENPSWKNKG